jgi:hypothetical protein
MILPSLLEAGCLATVAFTFDPWIATPTLTRRLRHHQHGRARDLTGSYQSGLAVSALNVLAATRAVFALRSMALPVKLKPRHVHP